MKKLLSYLVIFVLILSCSSEDALTIVAPTPIINYTITFSAGNGGSVSTIGGEYQSGQTVTVTATPQGEYLFTSWSDGNTDATRTVTVTSTKTITANFEKKKYPLTVNIVGEGEVSEEIVNAGRNTDYNSGTTLKLTAIPSYGWEFVGWYGAIVSSESIIQITVNESKQLSAVFKEREVQYLITIVGKGTYDITKIEGGLVKITPKPDVGWKFLKWNITNDMFILINPYEVNEYTLTFNEKTVLENSFDKTELNNFYASLTNLSKEWIQSDVNSSNSFLMKYQNVSEEIWEELFNEYFKENIFTETLFNYLQYPSFSWLGDKVNTNIQKGIYKPLTNKLLGYDNFINNTEESKQILRLFGMYLKNINQENHRISKSIFYEYLFSNLELFIKTSNQKLLSNYILTIDEKDKLADLKAQLYYVLSGIAFLDNSYKQKASEIISLDKTKNSLIKLSIWNKHTILVNDNEFFNQKSIEMISNILDGVPNRLHQVTSFTNSAAITNPHKFHSIGGFNVFDVNLNHQLGNGFPNDTEPYYGDLLYSVFVHELNHNVDSYFIKNNERLNTFKNLIINQAGELQINYLRSIIEEGYFIKNPQEFIASISNMYFVNAEKTFEVALQRASQNNYNPLNQFLLFAQVYSDGNIIKFFKNSVDIPFAMSEIICEKDNEGFIISLSINNKKYSFILNEDKTVKQLSIE
jgi:hypothetical protein